MPTHSRVYSKDEELGKRDDDFKPKHAPSRTLGISAPWRWRKRRVLAVMVVIVFVYLLVRYTPADLRSLDAGGSPRPGYVAHGPQELKEPRGAPPRTNLERGDDRQAKHYYDGPIRFYRLATSLHGIARTSGSRPANRNVLFAASSLKSVANLMPMACDMARWDRNYVHLAVLGRDALPMENILEINGVNKEECSVYFHDARPDYSEFSNDRRAEVSAAGAMKHINDFMHPQVIIMDDSTLEDEFFTRAVRMRTNEYRRALIEVPAGRYEEFLWMTRLDSGSLASWFEPKIDVLIHAPPDSSGGLVRLVKSLQNADYTGLRVPAITIELPSNVEYFAQRYLEDLDWPPEKRGSPMKTNALSLRHRIPSARITPEEASLRFLESYYPTSAAHSHILVLSPQAEVNSLFLQYLFYLVLEYRYASYGSPDSEDLLGLSLDVPFSLLNGSGTFKQPKMLAMKAQKYTQDDKLDRSASAPFLYQAPSSTASLVFGDKWATLHNFLKNRLASSHAGTAEKKKKIVSETEPAWLEYLLELMRARGWSMLHPASSLVTVHNELASIPEEFLREPEVKKKAESPKQPDQSEEEAFLIAPNPPVIQQHIEQDINNGIMPLHELLPFHGDLPELPHLPFVYHTGDTINASSAREYKSQYTLAFRKDIGGCEKATAERPRLLRALKTDDLFCLPTTELEFDEEGEEEASGPGGAKSVAEAIAKATAPNIDAGGE